MKILLFICTALLLLSLASFSMGYYTFLRIVVCVFSVIVVLTEFENGVNVWVIGFGISAVLFNPFIPIHLSKAEWMPVDITCAVLFFVKALKTDTTT